MRSITRISKDPPLPYIMCGLRYHQGELVRTREDDMIESYIQDLEEHIREMERHQEDGPAKPSLTMDSRRTARNMRKKSVCY